MYDRRPWYIVTLKIVQRRRSRNSIGITYHSDVRFTNIIYRHARNWIRKLMANSNGHILWLEFMIDAHYISRLSKLNTGSSREIQMAITFHSNVRFVCIIYRDPRNWTLKLSKKSKGHNFWHECMIDTHDISGHSKFKNGSSCEIQMAITFHSDVRFTCIIYREPQNWTWMLSTNPNGHKFWIECMIDAHDISRRSKLNTEALGKFKRPLLLTRMYDWRPWYIETLKIEQQKLSRNSNGYNFSLGSPIHVHHISRPSKLNTEALNGHNFWLNVWSTPIIYRDAQNLIRKLSENSNGHYFWLECLIDAPDKSRR